MMTKNVVNFPADPKSESLLDGQPTIDPVWLSSNRAPNWTLRMIVVGIVAALLTSAFSNLIWTINVLLHFTGCLILFMAAFRILACAITAEKSSSAKVNVELEDLDWPLYTVLVPLYREAHMVESLTYHLRQLDYPAEKLDIILVTEADDKATNAAAHAFATPPFRVHAVPTSQPRTKPKALNHALAYTPPKDHGEFITIYDAEDQPHPNQLKSAVRAFRADITLAAVQAPLRFRNDHESLLSGLFALEYAALFYVWNPALARLGLPIPLGGTSNHVRRSILEAAGGWDPFNVTEDADLAFRIPALETPQSPIKFGMIDQATDEEAISTHKDWVNQRSRWLKGFIQSWTVHMRKKKYGPNGQAMHSASQIRNTFTLQITLAATLLAAFLHLPSVLIGGGALLLEAGGYGNSVLAPASKTVIIFVLIVGYGAALLCGILGALRAKQARLVFLVPIMPFYWLLYFRPALIAAYEFIAAPSYWRKTRHVGPIESPSEPPESSSGDVVPRNTPQEQGQDHD